MYVLWIIYALLAAVFASATAILSKIGLKDVNSNLAMAIRTIVILVMAWGIVFVTGQHKAVLNISQKSLWFLVGSGVATGLSWLFYFKAIQIGEVSKVAPLDKLSLVITMILAFLVLGEKLDIKQLSEVF